MTTQIEFVYRKDKKVPIKVFTACSHKVVVEGTLVKIARLKDEYETEISDPGTLIRELARCGCKPDVFTFWDRVPANTEPLTYPHDKEIQALLPVHTYEQWWNELDRGVRKIVRRSSKKGVTIRTPELDDDLLIGLKRIFDETPLKRNKHFWYYDRSIEDLREALGQDRSKDSEFLVAYYGEEVIGFMKLIYRDKFADPVVFISKMEHFDKYPNNLLLAKAVERCAEKNLPFLHYSDWRLGSHGDFLRRNGFRKFAVNRYYVPLTIRGKIAVRFGMYQPLWSRVPESTRIRILKLRGLTYRLIFRFAEQLLGKKFFSAQNDYSETQQEPTSDKAI